MKVALCLAGQMRSSETCFGPLKKFILDPLTPDIFLHTWDSIGGSHKNDKIIDRPVSAAELEARYAPKALVVETRPGDASVHLCGKSAPLVLQKAEPVHFQSALPMYYQIQAAFELMEAHAKKTAVKYDIVLRARPDTVFLESISLPLLRSAMRDDKVIYYPDYAINTKIQVSDKFAFGSPNAMGIYCRLWDSIEEHWQSPLGENPPQTHRVGERLMKHHVDSNLQVDARVFRMRMYTLRNNGVKQFYRPKRHKR